MGILSTARGVLVASLVAAACAPVPSTLTAGAPPPATEAHDRHADVRAATGLPPTAPREVPQERLDALRDALNDTWARSAPTIDAVAYDAALDQVVVGFGPVIDRTDDTPGELHRRYVATARAVTDDLRPDAVVLHPPTNAFLMPGLVLVYFGEDVGTWHAEADPEELWRGGVLQRMADGTALFDGSSRAAAGAGAETGDGPGASGTAVTLSWQVVSLSDGPHPSRVGLQLPVGVELRAVDARAFSLLATSTTSSTPVAGAHATWSPRAERPTYLLTVRPGEPDPTGELVDVTAASRARASETELTAAGLPALRTSVTVPAPDTTPVELEVLSLRAPGMVVTVAAGCSATCVVTHRSTIDAVLASVTFDEEHRP